jgi:type I restriction enzyme S subunit
VLPEIATNLNNMRIPITEQDRIPGDVPYYGASGIVDYVKDHIFDEDLLCVSEDGANLVARTYPIAFSISGRTWVNNHAHVLRFAKSVTQIIAQAYLNHIDISDYITGVAQPKLNRAMLDSIPIALPPSPHEQNDVAGCIVSLDHLLSMHRKKIESLSAHKKGLLLQLFPSLEEEAP